jgi:hypothetical protein
MTLYESVLLTLRPLSGHAVLILAPAPTHSGPIHIPPNAQRHRGVLYRAFVHRISPQRSIIDRQPLDPGFGNGDEVWFLPRISDMQREVVLVSVGTVVAVAGSRR